MIELFETLLSLDQVRGIDSTGVGFINRKNQSNVVRDAVLPYQLFRDMGYLKNISQKDNVCLIGHNRAATRGVINAANAHPHEIGSVILAHNGTLNDQEKLPDHKDFENDSRNLSHAVNKLGISEAWKLVDGPATIVYWDKRDASLNFVSNLMRPFHFAVLKGGHGLVWSSDDTILKEALRITGMEIAGKNGGDISKLVSDSQVIVRLAKKGGLTFTQRKLEPIVRGYRFQDNRVGQHVGAGAINRQHGINGEWKNGEWVNFADLEDELDNSALPFGMGHPTGGSASSTNGGGAGGTVQSEAASTHLNMASTKMDAPRLDGKKVYIPERYTAKGKGLTEDRFLHDYSNCVLCGDTLAQSYECALIVDSKSAVCEDCTGLCLKSDIRLV